SLRTRTAAECCIRWYVHDHPGLNHGEWTEEEDEHLDSLSRDRGERDWVSIATDLGTNRTAIACFRRYQQRKTWTKEEDEMLRQAVRFYGDKNWQQVAACLVNRTGQQCLHRWTKSLNPTIRSGRWTQEEDNRLRTAVEVYGVGSWAKIKSYVAGRTDVQCRERWVNVLDPSINKDPWSWEVSER
ncbi:Homeodomain-like protein, partial [Piptocephalis cylindrospora]